jgi:DNA-binding MarR family transcriptional regulator
MDSKSSKNTKADIARRMGKLLRQLMVNFKATLDERLKDHHVTTAQLRLLYEVRERPGGSGAQMARACLVTPQSAQAMLVLAVERGWMMRGKDAENERLVTFRLTATGVKLLEYAEGVAREIEAEVWAGVSVAELKAVSGLLERGLRNLEG